MINTVARLLEKLKDQTITAEEYQQLREAVLTGDHRDLIQNDILSQLMNGAPAAGWDEADADAILERILAHEETQQAPVHRIHFLRRAWLRYAAAIVLFAGASYAWLHYKGRQAEKDIAGKQQPTNIRAAKTGAILTLADGSNIVLDSAENRTVADQNGAHVVLKNGQLVYDATTASSSNIVYNTITTTKGNQFNIILPDGTRVYLNAASSIRYPTAFTGRERKVVVTGEAYFEVAKNPGMPFTVGLDNASIEVLGTSFNVNAYRNEHSIDATLVEGSVKIIKGDQTSLLKPGEQARITNNIHLIKDADVDKAIAWKNGIFNFEGVGLREMMRQIERWYDIEVVYGDNVKDEKFFGKISRKVDLATVLESLKGFGLRYEMSTTRKLIVTQ